MRIDTLVAILCVWQNANARRTENLQSSYNHSTLPVVNLGYELHQATSYNATTKLYTFSNIRYGQAPIGDLRFRASLPPEDVANPKLEKGEVGYKCPQADEAWGAVAMETLPLYFGGQTTFNESQYPFLEPPSWSEIEDPTMSEDCLFLDVITPRKIMDGNVSGDVQSAPVLVWIHGGGYVAGSKNSEGDPEQLVASGAASGNDFVYVQINYRLGAFGWLAGTQMLTEGDMNAGLYDQRLALDWVQSHISKFGGDPGRVTVMGESAGGGSIISQITAFGGEKGRAPFQQAIIQSPGIFPQPTLETQDKRAQQFLSLLNVTTIDRARRLPSKFLQYANYRQVFQATYGTDDFGPAVDGSIIPRMPGELLHAGLFDHGVKVLTSYVHDEGLLFANPFINRSEVVFRNAIIERIPELAGREDELDYITQDLYPPIFNGSQAYGYTNPIARLGAITADVAVVCYNTWIAQANANKTHGIRFNIPPAVHGQDVDYTFYPGPRSPPPPPPSTEYSVWIPDLAFYPAQAVAWQDIIVRFVTAPSTIPVPLYGTSSTLLDIQPNETSTTTDDGRGDRCKYWQSNRWYS